MPKYLPICQSFQFVQTLFYFFLWNAVNLAKKGEIFFGG